MRFDIQEMKKALPLPDLLVRLGAFEHVEQSMFCPFHTNTRTEAFNVYTNPRGEWKWRCHTECGGGDELDFLERFEGISKEAARERYAQLIGDAAAIYAPPKTTRTPKSELVAERPKVLKEVVHDLHEGEQAELATVARLRRVSVESVALMQRRGVLRFGTVCSAPCWIITDASGWAAEARRMDGRIFPAGHLGERKVHTVAGFKKSWPVGLMLRDSLHESFSNILWCEGSGDIVAGYHLTHAAGEQDTTWLPVAMLGASTRIRSEVLPFLKGKRIRIVPHVDDSGDKGAKRWAQQLSGIGCDVSVFTLEGLRKSDGSNVKDLNDCTEIHPDDATELEELLK